MTWYRVFVVKIRHQEVLSETRRRLESLAEVLPGYSEKDARGSDMGSLGMLQARDVQPSGTIDWRHLARCFANTSSERARLRDGDVLLTIRTADPRAVLVAMPPADVVAGGPFAVLRCKPEIVDATFLCWLLNTDSVRTQLRSAQRGTAMPFLGLADLKDFPLPVPPLPTQRAIARVHGLRLRMSQLATRLDRALERILEHTTRSSGRLDP